MMSADRAGAETIVPEARPLFRRRPDHASPVAKGWAHTARPLTGADPAVRAPRTPGRHGRASRIVALLLALLVAIPLLLVVARLLTPTREIWRHLAETILSRMVINTVLIVAGAGLGTLLLGGGLAWLVTAFQFPGRRLFEWALVLPMAIPSYIFAFVYIATFDYVGIVQSSLRGVFGTGVGFPNIYTVWSAILVLTLTLYPYVYLLARVSFRGQSDACVDAARTLGYSRFQTFLRVVVPLSRPALIGGASLAAMEALGDFATVRFFTVPTLSEGVFRIWEGMMNRDAAMELAGLLCLLALVLILLEQAARRRAQYTQSGGRSRVASPVRLRGGKAVALSALCALVLLLAFLLPVLQLSLWAGSEIGRQGPGGTLNVAFLRYTRTTVGFATIAATAAVVWALLLSVSVRASRRPLERGLSRVATLGYAMPGAVVAVGVLLLVTRMDRVVVGALGQSGTSVRSVLTGTMGALTYAYIVRFLAVAHSSISSGLTSVKRSMDEAAATLGASPARVLRRIHLPLVSRALLAGFALVFVDVMKELPVTMLLRPFGMDTLAIWGYLLAAEGFWEAASVPSLAIVGAGLVPVALLTRASGRTAGA